MKMSLMSMKKNKNCKSCLDFILSDEKVNDEKLKSLFPHSNKECIQEYLQGDVPLFVVQHVYRDPYLFDDDPSHNEVVKFFSIEFEADKDILFIQFQVLERLKRLFSIHTI